MTVEWEHQGGCDCPACLQYFRFTQPLPLPPNPYASPQQFEIDALKERISELEKALFRKRRKKGGESE